VVWPWLDANSASEQNSCKVCASLNRRPWSPFALGMIDSCVETRERDKDTLLVVRGQAPLAEAETLLAHARAAVLAGRDVQLDLGDAEHLHAGVLQVLIAFERAVRKSGRSFNLVGQSETARRALTLAGLADWPNGQAL